MEPEVGNVVARNADFFLKFGGSIALLWAFLRWLLLPMVKAGLRELLQVELAELRELAGRIARSDGRFSTLSRDLYDVECDVEELFLAVKENRELMGDVITALDATIGMERRKKGDASEMRRLPEIEPRKRRKPHRFMLDEVNARQYRELHPDDRGEGPL